MPKCRTADIHKQAKSSTNIVETINNNYQMRGICCKEIWHEQRALLFLKQQSKCATTLSRQIVVINVQGHNTTANTEYHMTMNKKRRLYIIIIWNIHNADALGNYGQNNKLLSTFLQHSTYNNIHDNISNKMYLWYKYISLTLTTTIY